MAPIVGPPGKITLIWDNFTAHRPDNDWREWHRSYCVGTSFQMERDHENGDVVKGWPGEAASPQILFDLTSDSMDFSNLAAARRRGTRDLAAVT
jgi:hypothetical protein